MHKIDVAADVPRLRLYKLKLREGVVARLGDPVDRHAPPAQRRTRDVPCLLCFVAAWVVAGLAFLAIFLARTAGVAVRHRRHLAGDAEHLDGGDCLRRAAGPLRSRRVVRARDAVRNAPSGASVATDRSGCCPSLPSSESVPRFSSS